MRNGWEFVPLGKYIKQSKKKIKVVDGEEYPAIGVMMEGRGFVTRPPFIGGKTTYKQLTPIEPDQLVLRSITAWEAPIQVTTKEHSGFHVSGVFPVFDIDAKNLNPQYLSLLCRYNPFWESMRERTVGSVLRRKTLSATALMDIPVHLPPLPDQKRIVDLITSVDSYIEALQQQLDSAKRSRNAVLHELLTTGSDDWIETTLGEICADGLFADGDWVESKDQDPEGDYRLLQLADIGDGTFLNKSDRWMNREQFNRLGCTKLEVNDVLIARMPDPIGRACLFPEGLPVCATVVDVAIVRTGNEALQKFLALLINSSDFRTEAFSLLTGTTRQRISRGNLAKISFAIPSQEKQLEIVKLISLFDGEIAQSVRVIEEAKQLRSGLLSDLLSGEHLIPASYDKAMGPA